MKPGQANGEFLAAIADGRTKDELRELAKTLANKGLNLSFAAQWVKLQFGDRD